MATLAPDSSGNVTTLYQDLGNLEFGDSVQLVLAKYTTTGANVVTRTVVSDAVFDMPSNIYALVSSTGALSAQQVPTTSTRPTVFARLSDGSRYDVTLSVLPKQVRLSGKVLTLGSDSSPVNGVIIDFYGVQGGVTAKLSSVTTAVDGTFRVSLPATGLLDTGTYYSFQVRNSSLTTAYSPRTLIYAGASYTTDQTNTIPQIVGSFEDGLRSIETPIRLVPAGCTPNSTLDGCSAEG